MIEVPDRAERLEGQPLDPGAMAELAVLVDLGEADRLVEAAQPPPRGRGQQQEIAGGVRELGRGQLVDRAGDAADRRAPLPDPLAGLPPVAVAIDVVAHGAVDVLVVERRRRQTGHQRLRQEDVGVRRQDRVGGRPAHRDVLGEELHELQPRVGRDGRVPLRIDDVGATSRTAAVSVTASARSRRPGHGVPLDQREGVRDAGALEQRVVVRGRRDQPLEELRAAVIVGAAGDDDLERLRVRRGREPDRRRGRRRPRRARLARRSHTAGGTSVRAAAGKRYGPGRSFSEKWHQCACGAHRSPSVRSIASMRKACAPIACVDVLRRGVQRDVVARGEVDHRDGLLDAAVEVSEADARARPVVAAPQACSARPPAAPPLRSGVADVVREDEMRPIGDHRQEPAEHVLGDVVAVRIPENQHPARRRRRSPSKSAAAMSCSRASRCDSHGRRHQAGDARPRLGPPARSTGRG